MKPLPDTDHALVLRTDYGDEDAWQATLAAFAAGTDDESADLSVISDPTYAGLEVAQVMALLPDDWSHTFLFIADHTTMRHPEHPLLVVDAFSDGEATFRAAAAQVWTVENNLSLGSMNFENFIDDVDEDGIFRRFAE